MCHEKTLEKVTEQAHQAEIICRMMESYPDRMVDSEITAISSLLSKLTGNVVAWLIEEQALREGK